MDVNFNDLGLGDVPRKQLKVTYGGAAVNPGDVRTPTQVKDPPTVEWEADPGAFYTLIMNDPDAPSPHDRKFSEWHHWMVVNIAGSDVSQGEVHSVYVGAGPPQDTGLHRYVFYLFKQKGKMESFHKDGQVVPKFAKTPDGRPQWKVAEFAKENNLGSPIEANFFLAEYDDYVPVLYKELGIAGSYPK